MCGAFIKWRRRQSKVMKAQSSSSAESIVFVAKLRETRALPRIIKRTAAEIIILKLRLRRLASPAKLGGVLVEGRCVEIAGGVMRAGLEA